MPPRVCSFCMGVVEEGEFFHPCDSVAVARGVNFVEGGEAWRPERAPEVATSCAAFPVWLQRAAYNRDADSYELELQLDDGALVEATMNDEECQHMIDALTQLRRRRQQATTATGARARRSRP